MSARRIIVCGSRDWNDTETLRGELDLLFAQFDPTMPERGIVIVHGACPFGGADAMAEAWADMKAAKGWWVKTEAHPPKSRGTAGFHARNQEMTDLGAYLCLGFTDGRDPQRGTWGTGDMFSRALRAGIPIRCVPSRKP